MEHKKREKEVNNREVIDFFYTYGETLDESYYNDIDEYVREVDNE